ncbi:unnamed protein product [Nezara viridula]|uniref:Retrovirus-related Pol polyprotein from transposon 17.6 n=1 Tax=Nezara viridula TaxID=85310 RepID=A0A9P0H2U5_NEZVI|nr:unnamed protein product [Nezara viridula]
MSDDKEETPETTNEAPDKDDDNDSGQPNTENNIADGADSDGSKYIKLKVVGNDQNGIHFRLKMTTQLLKLKKSYSTHVGVPVSGLRFLFDGKRISDDDTPKQFIRGLSDQSMRQYLLLQNPKTFNEAKSKALALEASILDNNGISGENIIDPSVGRLSRAIKFSSTPRVQRNSRTRLRIQQKQDINFKNLGVDGLCFRCGRNNHNAKDCRINPKKIRCKHCEKTGHVEKVCFKKLVSEKKNINSVKNEGTDSDSDSLEAYDIYPIIDIYANQTVQKFQDAQKYFVSIKIENKFQTFEVDSGAGQTLLPKTNFYELHLNAKMQSTNIRFRSYTSGIIPLGYVEVPVQYKNILSQEILFVVPDGLIPLLGRTWIRHLNIKLEDLDSKESPYQNTSIAKNSIACVNPANLLQNIYLNFKSIFEQRIDCPKSIQCNIKLRENSKPVYFKAREVPFALKIKMEEELYNLEREGIITPTQVSDWASPLIEAITEAPRPQNQDDIKRFLGIVAYYSRFIHNVSTITHPLRLLLQKKRQFHWSSDCELAFKKLKVEMANERVLVPFHPELPLVVASDTSPTVIAGVLSHIVDGIEKPIAFVSRSLSKSEMNYSQLDREALAIMFSLKKFYYFLFGRTFTLITDNKPLSRIFHESTNLPALTSARLLRYAAWLSNFDYMIQHRPAEENAYADYLSRTPQKEETTAIEEELNTEVDLISNEEVYNISNNSLNYKTLVKETARR